MKKIILIIISLVVVSHVNSQKLIDDAKTKIDADNYLPIIYKLSDFNNLTKKESIFSFFLVENKKYRIYLFNGTPNCSGELKILDNFNNVIIPAITVNKDKKYSYTDLVIEAKSSLKAIITHSSNKPDKSELLGYLAISKEENAKIITIPSVTKESDTTIYSMVDEMPQFITGDDNAFMKWFLQNFPYPEKAKKNGIQGKVYTQFVVDKLGKMRDIKIVRSIDPEIDEVILNTLKTAPAWQKPGKLNGKNVNVVFTFPVRLALK